MLLSPLSLSILFLVVLICFTSCTAKPEFNLAEGEKTYEKKCSPCHSYKSHNRMYSPSLHQMVNSDSAQLMSRLNNIETDKTHAAVIRFENKFEKNQLINFIADYMENLKPTD